MIYRFLILFFIFTNYSCSIKTNSNLEINPDNDIKTYSRDDKTSFINIDDNFFEQKIDGKKYLHPDDLKRFDLKKFSPTVTDLSYWYILDTIHFSDQFITLLLAQDLAEGNRQVYLVNYNKNYDLIDNKIIYRRKFDPKQRNLIYQMDATLRLDSSFIQAVDSGAYFFLREVDWKISILKNGKLNFFPKVEYSIDTIASGGCMGFGFNGKYPIGENWSILYLHDNTVRQSHKQGKLEVYKTKEHTEDPLFEIVTLVTDIVENPKDDDYFFVDLAFKGTYTNEDFDILKFYDEPIEKYQQYLDKFPMTQKFTYREFSNVKSFEYDNQKYILAYILLYDNSENNKYLSVAAITPNMELTELVMAPTYEDEIIPFRLKDKAYLYTVTHTFEGAGAATILYEINNNKIYQIYMGDIMCD